MAPTYQGVGIVDVDGERSPHIPHCLAEVRLKCTILVIIWHLLSDPEARYRDLGAGFHTNHTNRDRTIRNHVSQLTALGYRVTLELAA